MGAGAVVIIAAAAVLPIAYLLIVFVPLCVLKKAKRTKGTTLQTRFNPGLVVLIFASFLSIPGASADTLPKPVVGVGTALCPIGVILLATAPLAGQIIGGTVCVVSGAIIGVESTLNCLEERAKKAKKEQASESPENEEGKKRKKKKKPSVSQTAVPRDEEPRKKKKRKKAKKD